MVEVPQCSICSRDFCLCKASSNDNDSTGFIRIPHEETFRPPFVSHRIALALVNLAPHGRRAYVDWAASVIWNFDGIVVNAKGRRINHHDIDPDEILRTDADPEQSWIGGFLRHAVHPPRQPAQWKVLPRIELLWLALMIQFPSVGRHIL